MSELLGANTDVLERKAESLISDARRVQEIRTLAQRALGQLQASWNGSDLAYLTQQWEQQTSPLLAGASVSLDTCAARLRQQSAAQRVTSSSDAGTGNTASGFVVAPVAPPRLGSPADNATWWKSMTVLQQQQVLRGHPEWIGNRDGVDFTARDLANRALLPLERDRLIAERDRLGADLADNWFGGDLTNDDAALDHVNDKLTSLDAIQATLGGLAGGRQLLLLDLGQERAQAAIANGNVQTATNVAVFVPGLGSTVTDSMKGYDREMNHLQKRAGSESVRAHPTLAETTATVTWIGYQAPQWGETFTPGKSVAGIDAARKGAAQLTPFLQGVGAARDHDAHLTLLSHSYGTTTAGLALQQDTGVDDAVFFGSPGIGTNYVQDLNVAPGHSDYIEGRDDGVGDLGRFGVDPSHLSGMEHASAREATVVDPLSGEVRHFTESTGHSEYLLDNSTSQYNMSVLVAGVPDRQVFDPGRGFGDVLSFPIPGTY